MLRKTVTAIVLVPLAIVVVAFAVANRQTVTVSFDPFDSANPAYSMTMPLFLIVFAVLIAGVVIGGVAAWLRQGPWRRTARRLDDEVRQLHGELRSLRTRLDDRPSHGAVDRPQLPPGSNA